MTRGRRPKPEAVPAAQAGAPPAPEGMAPDARAEYARVAALLTGARKLTKADAAILELYAVNFCRWRRAEAELQRIGEIVKGPAGAPMQNPWLAVANKAAQLAARYAIELGLTPSARTPGAFDPSESDQLVAEMQQFVNSSTEALQ